MILPLSLLASYAVVSAVELSYGGGCNSSNKKDEEQLFDGDADTYCESDGVHSDAILMHFKETQQISGVRVTMTGYTGTVWFRARSNAGRAPATNYGTYLGCIGGEYWDRPDQRGGDVEIQITTGKQSWEFDLGEAKSIDCLGIAMSPYAGNPRGVYSPRPRLYEIEFITPVLHTCVCENGSKADDSTCPADDASNCESCDDGYALDGKKCAKTYSCSLYTSKKFCTTDYCKWDKGTGCTNKDGQDDLTSSQFCGAIKPKRVCDSYDNCFFWFDGGKTCISKVEMTQGEICAKTRGKKNCKGPDCAFNTAQKRCMLPSENSCELYTKKAHCNKNPCVNNVSCTWNKGNCESGGACGAGGGGGSQ